jgi:uncharacterized repeat protein (TIGR01451 family)
MMTNFQRIVTTALLAGFLLGLTSNVAAQQPHLDVTTTVQKEQVTENSDGERQVQLVPAATVVPGEKVIYTIMFRNISDAMTENVVITNPIAEELTFVDGSETRDGADVLFSVDDGTSFAARGELTVVDEGVRRPAEAKDFTHIRWVLQEELAAGAQRVVRFSAILD